MSTAHDMHPDIERYIDAMWMEKGLSDNSLSAYRRDFSKFEGWQQSSDKALLTCEKPDILAYLGHLQQNRISARSVSRLL